jgi:hypothetical protein
MLSLITSFSSKIYGKRSAENRKKKESKWFAQLLIHFNLQQTSRKVS